MPPKAWASFWLSLAIAFPMGGVVYRAIYSFHMPLFFFLAGWVSKDWAKGGSLPLIARRADGLLVPYVIYSSVYLVMGIGPGNFKSFLFGAGVSVTWFFSCLFAVELIGLFFKWCYASKKIAFATIALGVCAFLSVIVKLPLISALSYWAFGYWAARCHLRDRYLAAACGIQILVFVTFAAAWSLFPYNLIDMRVCQYGNLALFLLSAVGGIGMVMLIVLFMPKKLMSIFSMIGSLSLLVMVLHVPVLEVSACFVKPYLGRGGHLIVCCIVMAVACVYLNKCVPILTGRAKVLGRFTTR